MPEFLPQLGQTLATARKKKFPRDDLRAFALRIRVARSTYQKMEKGDLSVSMASYYRAAKILGLEAAFAQLFTLPVADRWFGND